MSKTNLTESLKLIDPDEWKDLERFADSPYFNRGRNYKRLLKTLRQFHPNFDQPDATSERIYRALYPGKPFNENVLKVLFSGLNKIVEEYITYVSFKADKKTHEMFFIDSLITRNSKRPVDRILKDILSSFENKPLSASEFQDRIRYLRLLKKYYEMNSQTHKQLHRCELEIEILKFHSFLFEVLIAKADLIENHLYDSFGELLEYLKDIYDSIDIERTLDLIKKHDIRFYNKLNVLTEILFLAKKSDEDSYIRLKKLVEEKESYFDKELNLRFILYIYVLNISLYNKSLKPGLIVDNIKIIEDLIRNDYMKVCFREDHLRPRMFMNGIVGCYMLGDPLRARSFFEKHIGKTSPQFRNTLSSYTNALEDFYTGRYDRALEGFAEINTDELSIKLDIKKYIAKIYYETNSFNSLYSLLDSYSHFVNSLGTESNLLYKRNHMFIRSILLLAKVKEAGNNQKSKLDNLKHELTKDNFNNDRWVQQKFLELENDNVTQPGR